MPNPLKDSYEKGFKCSAMAYLALLEDLVNYALHGERVFKGGADLLVADVSRLWAGTPDTTELTASVTCSHAASFLLFVMRPALS